MGVSAISNRDLQRGIREIRKTDRSAAHLLRRVYHLVMGISCFSLYAWGIERQTACWLLALIGGPFVLLDILRLQSPLLKRLAIRYFGPLMRSNEMWGLSGNSFYIVGMFLVVFFFSKPIALLSVLYLAVGDPVAALVGTRWGKHRLWAGKSLEGSTANFTVSAGLSAWFAHTFLDQGAPEMWIVGVVGGAVSALVELLPFPVDDNLSVPVLSALLLSLVQEFYPLLS